MDSMNEVGPEPSLPLGFAPTEEMVMFALFESLVRGKLWPFARSAKSPVCVRAYRRRDGTDGCLVVLSRPLVSAADLKLLRRWLKRVSIAGAGELVFVVRSFEGHTAELSALVRLVVEAAEVGCRAVFTGVRSSLQAQVRRVARVSFLVPTGPHRLAGPPVEFVLAARRALPDDSGHKQLGSSGIPASPVRNQRGRHSILVGT
jgi:hypothetical protein